MQIAETSAYYREALRLGVCTPDEVIAWADGLIAELASPQIDLVELALLGDANPLDLLHKLEALSREIAPVPVLPQVLAAAHGRLQAHPEFGPVLARGLYDLYIRVDYTVPDELTEIGYFDDAYSLAQSGTHGTEEQVYTQLLEFAARFVDA